MWIRSQDRSKLIDAKEIHIEVWADKRSYIISDNIVVASYSSEEKALKAMDMIHSQLIFCTEKYTKVSPVLVDDQWEPFWKKHEVVFQMQQDDEVEV